MPPRLRATLRAFAGLIAALVASASLLVLTAAPGRAAIVELVRGPEASPGAVAPAFSEDGGDADPRVDPLRVSTGPTDLVPAPAGGRGGLWLLVFALGAGAVARWRALR